MSANIYEQARRSAVVSHGERSQLQNRSWWEQLPMTYAAWDGKERLPKTKSDFELINRAYLDMNPWLKHNFEFAAYCGREVLEIGCGAGSAACLFASRGARVSAIDLTEQGIVLTRRNAQALGLPGVMAVRMDAEAMGFPDHSFDFAYSWGVIHHSRSPELILREIARVLKPGGQGLLMVYNRESLRYWLKGAYWLILKGKVLSGENFASVQRFFTDGFFQRHYSARELIDSLAMAGLATRRVSYTHMAKKMIPYLPRRADELLKRRYGWLLVSEFEKRS